VQTPDCSFSSLYLPISLSVIVGSCSYLCIDWLLIVNLFIDWSSYLCLCTYLLDCLYFCLFVCLPVCWSTCLPVCLCVQQTVRKARPGRSQAGNDKGIEILVCLPICLSAFFVTSLWKHVIHWVYCSQTSLTERCGAVNGWIIIYDLRMLWPAVLFVLHCAQVSWTSIKSFPWKPTA